MASRRMLNLIIFLAVSGIVAADVVTLEDLSLSAESYWNGSDASGGFTSAGTWFNNNYNATYGSWDGFSYSNITDTTSSGLSAQYNTITGEGEGSSSNYAIGWDPVAAGFGTEPPTVTFGSAGAITGLYVTNNNYAYYSMLNGDAFSKKFGGDTGSDADWFLLTVTGKDTGGSSTGSADFYLADYRFSDNGLDYIVDTWQFVDLSPLGTVKGLEFSLSSSDTGVWGMNTPAYFVIDTIVPEPATILLLGAGGLMFRRRRAGQQRGY